MAVSGTTAVFGGAAIIGVITALWGKIRALFSRAISYLVVTVTVQDRIEDAIKIHLRNNYKKSPFGNKTYSSSNQYIKSAKRRLIVGYEIVGRVMAVYWGRKMIKGWNVPFQFAVGESSSGDGDSPKSRGSSGNGLSITFLRGTIDYEQMIVDSIDELNRLQVESRENNDECNRFYVRKIVGKLKNASYGEKTESLDDVPATSENLKFGVNRLLKWDTCDLGVEGQRKSPLKCMSLSPDAVLLIGELKRWLDSKDWFLDRGVPWKRGWLLYGTPGTGKTCFVRAIAQEYDLPVFSFDLATLSNEEMIEEWGCLSSRTPCIALMEDIDNVFDGRKNIAGERMGNLTFDALLNCIDGVEGANGVLVIITTNHVDKLDGALGVPNDAGKSTRPGRIDRVLEMKELDAAGRKKMASRILDAWPEECDKVIADGNGDTGAQFQERCITLAQKLYWEGASYP